VHAEIPQQTNYHTIRLNEQFDFIIIIDNGLHVNFGNDIPSQNISTVHAAKDIFPVGKETSFIK
jgi:hypothetical protein